MSLKTYIQALLNTRTTPLQASNNAMPLCSAKAVTTYTTNASVTEWNEIMNGTAPTDGYLSATGYLANTESGQLYVSSLGDVIMGQFSYRSTSTDGFLKVFVPLAKGRTFQVRGANLNDIKIIFVSTIGATAGGVKRLISWFQTCLGGYRHGYA